MQINSISFGKKFPIAQTQIYDKNSAKFVPATVYEYDCSDESDIQTIKSLKGDWDYKDMMVTSMFSKHRLPVDCDDFNNTSFYVLENLSGEIVGLSEICNKEDKKELKIIETQQTNRYKYAGQGLLATIAKTVIDEDKDKLVIKNPSPTSYDFYTKGCGFVPQNKYSRKMQENLIRVGLCSIEMDREKLNKFIKQVEDKIQGSINITA